MLVYKSSFLISIMEIPQCKGLSDELSGRCGDSWRFYKGKERILEGREYGNFFRHSLPFPVTTSFYNLFSLDSGTVSENLGVLSVDTFSPVEGILRVARIAYKGKIPGYVNPMNGRENIHLWASQYYGIFTLDLVVPTAEEVLNSNNTEERPLYRIDGHVGIRLAVHEVFESTGIIKPNVSLVARENLPEVRGEIAYI